MYFIVKGGENEDCSEVDGCETRLATVNEIHAVRCCSDVELNNWSIAVLCSIWASSNSWGICAVSNWFEAAELCADSGGRLCTKEELEQNCAQSSDCEFDSKLVWSNTTGGKSIFILKCIVQILFMALKCLSCSYLYFEIQFIENWIR